MPLSAGAFPYPARHGKQSLRAWLHLIKCSKRVEQEVSELFWRRHQSTLPRFDVLSHLESAGERGLSTTSLAQRLLASKGNITRLLDRMEADGLIERRPAEGDRRIVNVLLTAKGTEMFRAMAQDHELWADAIFSVLSSEELEGLIQLLERVRQRVDVKKAENSSPAA